MSGSWPGQEIQWPGTPLPPSPQNSIAGTAGQFGAGFNSRLADVVGALPNLYDAGLGAVGLPRLFGNERQTASERILGGINSVIGTPPAPQTATERFAHGAGAGLMDAATIAVPAAQVARATAPVAAAAPSLLNRSATALAAQPGMQAAAGMAGGAVGEATGSPMLGAATAFATPMAANLAARIITPLPTPPNPGRQAMVRTAEREGIPLTAGQATGNRLLRNIESQLEQLPLTAGPQRALREAQETAFVRAAWRRAGEEASDTMPETILRARNRIGGTIGEIANRNTLRYTPELDAQLAQIEDSLRFLPAEAAGPVRARLEQIRGMVIPEVEMGAGARIPGPSYRMMDSELGRSARGTSNGDLRTALGDLRTRLRTAMDDSISPADAEDWQRARREYANMKVIARAAGNAGEGAAEGRMSPVALRGALSRSLSEDGYALGRGDLNDLARLGQGPLRPPADSNTAGRSMANSILTGSLMAGGATGGTMVGGPLGGVGGAAASLMLPRLIQALMNSPGGQNYLRNQALPNPATLNRELLGALLAQQGTGQAVAPR